MKILSVVAAALVAVTGLAAVPAVAAPAPAQDRVVVRERATPSGNTRVTVRERTTVRRSYGYNNRKRRVCTVRYRRGERIRTCRFVRRYR